MPGPPLKRVEELFHQAVALPLSDRPAFLEEACAGDAELRAAVEALLRHDAEDDITDRFLVSPLAREAEALRPEDPTVPGGPWGRASTADAPLPRIAGYEVRAELGRGGMGAVYKVRQLSLNRIVALKMLLPDGPVTHEMLVRFRTEAEALARLHHPNIVPIYDIGESEGRPYFTMEYVAGPSLADVLDGRQEDGQASARLIETMARTIHAVHQCGIIHRDLKPANILLSNVKGQMSNDESPTRRADGAGHWTFDIGLLTPKITDFGLAKDQNVARQLTRSGTAMGTPSYMAPEQARSLFGAVGPAADIYALGSILYELLTGRPPFDADTPAETIVQLIHDEPLSPASLRPRLPRDLVTICLKCLEKSPRQRYATALDLAEDLRAFQAGEPIRARPVGLVGQVYRWCGRRPFVAGLTALSSLLIVAFVGTVMVYEALLQDALAKAKDKAEQTAETERQQIVELNVTIGITALENDDTFTAALHFSEALRLDQGSFEHEHNHRTRIAATLRQSPQLSRLLSLDRLVCGALSPDGHVLAATQPNGTVRIWDWDTGKTQELSTDRNGSVRRMIFNADHRHLVAQHEGSLVGTYDLDNPKASSLPRTMAGHPAFSVLSDNGQWLFALDADGVGQVWEVRTGKAIASPLKPEEEVRAGAMSADGKRLALVGPGRTLTIWDVPGGKVLRPPIPLGWDVSLVVFHPEGEQILVAGRDRTAQIWDVPTGRLLFARAGLDHRLTDARFSTDGRLLLTGDSAGTARVWDAQTGEPVTPPLRHDARLALAAFREGDKQIVTVSTSGTVCFWDLSRTTKPDDRVPAGEDAVTEEFAGGRELKLGNDVTVQLTRRIAGPLGPPRTADRVVEQAVLSPDGRRVVACDEDGTVRIWDTDTRQLAALPLRHRSPVRYAAFSRDGHRLITVSDDHTTRAWDADTGEMLAPPLKHAQPIQRVFFHGDGDWVRIVHENGVVTTWDLTPDQRSVNDLVPLTQVNACAELNDKEERRALLADGLRALWKRLHQEP
jgi:serine/threonine protein kinase/WD40 repeat protein